MWVASYARIISNFVIEASHIINLHTNMSVAFKRHGQKKTI